MTNEELVNLFVQHLDICTAQLTAVENALRVYQKELTEANRTMRGVLQKEGLLGETIYKNMSTGEYNSQTRKVTGDIEPQAPQNEIDI